MKIGIVSDTHGRADRLGKALAVLSARGAEAVVHCGDIGGGECISALAEAGLPAYAVAGNMDRHIEQLQAQAGKTGVRFSRDTILVPLAGGAYLAATHGDRSGSLEELLASGQFPYVCHGHTHRPRNEKIGEARVINPGALHHARVHTAALLDTETDTVERLEIR